VAERNVRAALHALVAALAFGAVPAAAESIDPTLPSRRVVGPPAGAAPMWRVDAARTGRARGSFVASPKVLWRARITGGLDLTPVVDRRGHVIVATPGARLTELDEKGKVAWTTRTGSSSVVLGPLLTSDGTRVVVTATGNMLGVTSDGRVRFDVPLPVANVHGGAAPLATSDGGLVLAVAGQLLRFDSGGSISSRAPIAGPVASVLEQGARVLVVLAAGDVVEWKPPQEPTVIGSFGGRVEEGAALSSDHHLTAVVDQKRVVDLNLKTATRHVRVESTELLQGPPAIAKNGETRVASYSGLLLGHDRTGAETTRVALEPSPVLGGGAPALVGFAVAPPLVVDDGLKVAFARPGLDVGVVSRDGNVTSVKGAACGDPLAVLPAAKGQLLLACRSGLVMLLGA
jgi:hypothetical protein